MQSLYFRFCFTDGALDFDERGGDSSVEVLSNVNEMTFGEGANLLPSDRVDHVDIYLCIVAESKSKSVVLKVIVSDCNVQWKY